MRIICVDDEPLNLNGIVSLCKEIEHAPEVEGFDSGKKALDYLENNECDIAILDISMPEMDGLVLASKIKNLSPETTIIFLTGYSQYALDAYKLHVSGYLLKPVDKSSLEEEVDYALSARARLISSYDSYNGKNGNALKNKAGSGFYSSNKKEVPHIRVHTFGEFDVFVDGHPVTFARAKAKELLAHLVDRQGGVSRAEIFATLWEDGMYDRPAQKQLDVIIRSLRDTLNEYGISEILELERGILRVVPETFDCDLYRFMDGDIETIQSYRGEYLSEYSWASLTEAYMDRVNNTDYE